MRKKINNQGFTLIELLAVIIILAIIALIAVPTIMNIIENSRKSAAADSALGLISAGELWYSEAMLEGNGNVSTGDVVFTNTGKKFTTESTLAQGVTTNEFTIKGDAPDEVTGFKVSSEGKVTFSVKIDGFSCEVENSELTGNECTKPTT